MGRRVAAGVLVVLIAGVTPALAGNINKRQARQQGRIYQGIVSGELTQREARRLESQEAHIAAVEARDRRSGDGLSRREYRSLERDLSRESRNIYRQKHDGQTR
jgi:hypothetical protein